MKNKIQYVRVTGCENNKWWYSDLIGAIIPVTKETKIDYIMETATQDHYIKKINCEPVKMKELDKDIDGNYLECGDEVMDSQDQQFTFIAKYGDVYICMGALSYYELKTVRKIPKEEKNKKEPCYCYTCEIREACHVCPLIKEEKKVDPIEIVHKIMQKHYCSAPNNMSREIISHIWDEIKQHMEDRKE